MCMIAHRGLSRKGKGANIPNAVIQTAIYRHPDGYGVAWRDPEAGLVYEKFGPKERHEFAAYLKDLDKDNTIEYVAHFRYATHGPEDQDHAHPFAYEDPDPDVGTVLVFHNGIIGGVKPTKDESDTEVFVRDYLAKLPSKWWENEGIRELVDHMGGWSRLVLMTNAETVNLNFAQGQSDKGIWYSSDHTPSQYNISYGKYGDWDQWDEDNGLTKGSTTTGIPYRAIKSADIGETTYPRANDNMWMHQGHELQPMQEFDFTKDGDYQLSVLCETCSTGGDVYIIDGKAYIDIPHKWDTGTNALVDSDDEDLAILPESMSGKELVVLTGASGTEYARVH